MGQGRQEILGELESIDREGLLSRMAGELPGIRSALGLSAEALSEKLEMDLDSYLAVEEGKRALRWSEYMPLLFLFWNNDSGRRIVEGLGLFPDSLKRAMSLNRNAHDPSG